MHQPSLYVLSSVMSFDIVYIIDSFMPYPNKKKERISPSLQKELIKIQNLRLKGLKNTYLKDFEHFCLD
jgi:hypothetical protein